MEKEEAIKEIKNASDEEVRYGDIEHHYEDVMKRVEAFEMAIEALEQKPCEDAVSRQAVIDTIYHECSDENLDIDFAKVLLLQRKIKALPSVNPQKTGYWIADVDRWGNFITTVNGYRCSECSEFNGFNDKFCPNCGARMGGGAE